MKLLQQKFNIDIIPKWIPIAMLALALIGFADSLYLTIEHFMNIVPPCTIAGCDIVLTSSYSEILGIPVALFGLIYYLTISILLFIFLDFKREIILRITAYISVFGFLFSIYFICLMIFIIKAFCTYCIISAITSITIFIFSYYIFHLSKRINNMNI